MNTDPNPRIAQAIQQDLAAIGITANIQNLAQANVIEAGRRGHGPDDLVGRHGLDRRLPRSVQLLRPDPWLRGAGEGGWNWSKFCDEALDAKAVEADSMFDPAKSADRLKLWSDVYMGVMEQAPLGAGLQRRALHDEVGTDGRRGRALRRSGLDPGQLRLRLGQTVMCKACDYTIHGAQHHFRLGQLPAPALRVAPGSTIEFHCHDSVRRASLARRRPCKDVVNLDFGKINPVSGPIYVDGAKPGDVLKVTLDRVCPQGVRRQGLWLDGEHPRLRAAGRPVHRPRAVPLVLRSRQHGTRAVGQVRRVPLKPFSRHHRQCARRKRACILSFRPAGSAATLTSAT
jgi:hypothetical protein